MILFSSYKCSISFRKLFEFNFFSPYLMKKSSKLGWDSFLDMILLLFVFFLIFDFYFCFIFEIKQYSIVFWLFVSVDWNRICSYKIVNPYLNKIQINVKSYRMLFINILNSFILFNNSNFDFKVYLKFLLLVLLKDIKMLFSICIWIYIITN